MSSAPTLLERWRKPGLQSGHFPTPDGVLSFGSEGLVYEGADGERVWDVQSIQVSRSTHEHRPWYLAILGRKPIQAHLLHVELRTSSKRRRFSAQIPHGEEITELPALEMKGPLVPFEALAQLVENTLALGAELVHVADVNIGGDPELLPVVHPLEVDGTNFNWSPAFLEALKLLKTPRQDLRDSPNVLKRYQKLRQSQFWMTAAITLVWTALALLMLWFFKNFLLDEAPYSIVFTFGLIPLFMAGALLTGMFGYWRDYFRRSRHFKTILRSGRITIAEVYRPGWPFGGNSKTDHDENSLAYRFPLNGGTQWIHTRGQNIDKVSYSVNRDKVGFPPYYAPIYVLYNPKHPHQNLPWLDPKGFTALVKSNTRFKAQKKDRWGWASD